MAISRRVFKNLGISSKERTFDFNYFLQKIDSSTDESVQNFKYAKSFKNFSTKQGVLSTGLGLEDLKFYSPNRGEEVPFNPTYSGQPLCLYCFPYTDPNSNDDADSILLYTSAKKLYYANYMT